MVSKKIRNCIIPTTAGVLIAFALLYLYNELMAIIYFSADGDEVFSANAFYFPLFLMTFIPIILIAGIFQHFVFIPIWENYKRGKHILNLKLWQLIIIASITFATSITLFNSYELILLSPILVKILCASIITIAYWIINLATLNYLNKEKSLS